MQEEKNKTKNCFPPNFEKIATREFKKYDTNGNGVIEKKELNLLCKGMAIEFGFEVNEFEKNTYLKKSLMEEIDGNDDDRITFEEFKKYFTNIYLNKI